MRGDLYVKDGITQNTHVYMENVYYKDGAVYYTLANLSSSQYFHASAPYVERWNGEEWVPDALYSTMFLRNEGQPAYSTFDRSFRIDTNYAVAGEYRLVYDGCKRYDPERQNVYHETRIYVVGYFTLPATE